jgi:nucleoside-diphosphate-sugar epimerase
MSCFLIGSSGNIGLNILNQLVQDDTFKKIHIFLRSESSFDYVKSNVSDFSNIIVHYGDVTNIASLEMSIPQCCNCVFNSSGIIGNLDHQKEQQMLVTCEGVKNIIEICLSKKVERFIHVSSISVFFGEISIPYLEKEINDESKIISSNINYPYSKYNAELIIQKSMLENSDLDAVIVNPSTVSGRFDKNGLGKIVKMRNNDLYRFFMNRTFDSTFLLAHGESVGKAIVNCYKFGKRGENYILAGSPISFVDYAILVDETLNKSTNRSIKSIGYKTSLVLNFIDSCISTIFCGVKKKLSKELLLTLTMKVAVDSSKAKDVLKYEVTPHRVIIEEHVNWLRSQGLL